MRKSGRILLLVFQVFWLNVVVPGHQRGVVSLPGSGCACAACGTGEHAPAKAPAPRGDAATHCAICHFAARVTPPPIYDFTPPRLGLAAILDVPAPAIFKCISIPACYDGRAPPLNA